MLIIILVSIILLILGIIFILISNTIIKKNKQLYLKCTDTINATLDKYIEKESTWPDTYATSYQPIYKYIVNNKEYTCTGFGVTNKEKSVSNNIIIHYNPNNPSESYIEEDTKKYTKLNNVFKKTGILLMTLATILLISTLVLS